MLDMRRLGIRPDAARGRGGWLYINGDRCNIRAVDAVCEYHADVGAVDEIVGVRPDAIVIFIVVVAVA